MTTQAWLLALTVFGACAVEMVEALTIVLAVGAARGWRSALEGTAVALGILVVLVAAVGVPLVHYVPLRTLRVVVGALLLTMGLPWLRKAWLRASGHVALHDEDAIYARTVAELTSSGAAAKRDAAGFLVAMKGVLLEGSEVVVIVLSLGASQHHLLLASSAALAAFVVVAGVGAVVARQLSSVPENAIKLTVGIALSSFGVFWVGEGAGVSWPAGDLFLLALLGIFAVASLLAIRLLRAPRSLSDLA